VLAGVGLSNLAAWLGVERLKRDGHSIELMAEIGMFGYAPRPGEPFIFASRNQSTCTMMTDVMGVLGTFVGGPGTHTIGMIGAAQIDQTGRTNSTYADDGSFLVGSGGANDIMSAAEEVIVSVSHQPGRIVDKVAYVTCPGERVRSIVTSLGVFERESSGDEFRITRVLPSTADDIQGAIERMRALTPWPVVVGDGVDIEAPPTAEEISDLRAYDPQRTFLR
jgi:acyl CoA:acetate/3-ketoacid CoA transferase beta subunit